MAPAEVAFSPSFRITLRQFEEPATASVNWASDHVRSNFEGRAIPEPYYRVPTFNRVFEFWSGRRDLNPRPSVPQTDTLTKLRHVP
jgi:hypothetical protein